MSLDIHVAASTCLSRYCTDGEGVWFLKIPVRNFQRLGNSKLESDLPFAGPFEKVRKMMTEIVGLSRGS